MSARYKNRKYQIPKDWAWREIEDIAFVLSGSTPKGLNDQASSELEEFPFYKVSDMNNDGNQIKMNVSNLYLNETQVKKLGVKIHPQDTIIFPKRGGAILTNKKRLLSRPAGYDLNLMGLKTRHFGVRDLYLWYWFQRINLSSLYDGSNVPQINNKDIAPLFFPIAPLPEQRAIVAKIELLFSELDNGIANLKAAKDKLEIYRQAVLKKAFEGGFTKSGKWESKKLGDIIKISSGNGLTKANRNDEGQYLVYGGNGVTGRHDDFMFEDQQLIIGRVGVHCGNTHITEPKCWVTDNAFVVTFDKEEITLKCLYYLILSLRLNQYASSTAQPVISGGKVYPVEFLFPPKEIQGNLVDEIESRLSVCNNILANIEEGLEKSEALRQSILKQAFEGKLLSLEELESCRQEPDWEPAEKLLERVKNQKELAT